MKARRRDGPSTFVTVAFSFCTALVLFAILRSFISDPGDQTPVAPSPIVQEAPKPIILVDEKPQELPKPLVDEKPVEQSPHSATQHIVKEKETLSSISKKYYGTESKWEKIWLANKDIIPNKNRIRPGLTITIPE